MKKESTGIWGCVGIVILFFLLIKFWYIIIIGLGIWAIYHYREPIMDFYHRKPFIALVIGFFSIILLITGIAIAETPSPDSNNPKTEKVAKSSDDSDGDTDESDEDVDSSSSDNTADDESSSSEETSSSEDNDTDNTSSESDTDSVASSRVDESSNDESSSSTKGVSSTQEGDWTVAGPGMVFVSDNNLYYSRVKNPGNYQYVSQQNADSSGAHRAPRGNEYARP